MKLKTLKDLGFWVRDYDLDSLREQIMDGKDDYIVEVAKLKAEAVKDYKNAEKFDQSPLAIASIRSYIKWKFNITEEDLK